MGHRRTWRHVDQPGSLVWVAAHGVGVWPKDQHRSRRWQVDVNVVANQPVERDPENERQGRIASPHRPRHAIRQRGLSTELPDRPIV
jgi:hypothetical protein